MNFKKHKQTLSFVILFITIISNSSAQSNHQDPKTVDMLIVKSMKIAKIPGLSIAIIDNFEPTYIRAFGLKNMDTKEQVDTNTVFEAASLTKPVFAYTILRLVQENKLNLDKPLYKYYRYEDLVHDKRYKKITARMVLSHTSGLPNWRSNRKSDTVNLKYNPGTKFSYSGEGFVYLQNVVEHLLKKRLDTIISDYVFKPLKMNHSSLVFEEDNYAFGHDTLMEVRPKFKPKKPYAAYSLHTTAADYSRFLKALAHTGLLNESLHSEMIEKQIGLEHKSTLGWGLGVGLNFADGDTFLWHWGDNGVFKSFFNISPKTGKGFTFFANSENGLGIVRRLINLIYKSESILSEWDAYKQYQ